MTTKIFNAKKMLMSTVAAVVFSFVFTTSANANTPEPKQKDNVEVRVKGSANGDKSNVRVRVKGSANGDSQQQPEENSGFVSFLLQVFGVRV